MNPIYRATTKVLQRQLPATFLQQQQQQCHRHLTSTASCSAGGKLRVSRGQAEDASSYGPMTDLPDFTVVKRNKKSVISGSDGVGDECRTSPAVMTKRQMQRQMQRVSVGATIANLLKEIDEQKVETGKYGILEEQHRDY